MKEGFDDDLTSLSWLQSIQIFPHDQPAIGIQEPLGGGLKRLKLSQKRPHDNKSEPAGLGVSSLDNFASGSPKKKLLMHQRNNLHQLTEYHNQMLRWMDYPNEPDEKPPYSYSTLICLAMKGTNKKMTLKQIYKWIRENFAFYRGEDKTWENSIRHNLSLNKCFVKIPRTKDEPGKGGFWTLDAKYKQLKSFDDQGDPLGLSTEDLPVGFRKKKSKFSNTIPRISLPDVGFNHFGDILRNPTPNWPSSKSFPTKNVAIVPPLKHVKNESDQIKNPVSPGQIKTRNQQGSTSCQLKDFQLAIGRMQSLPPFAYSIPVQISQLQLHPGQSQLLTPTLTFQPIESQGAITFWQKSFQDMLMGQLIEEIPNQMGGLQRVQFSRLDMAIPELMSQNSRLSVNQHELMIPSWDPKTADLGSIPLNLSTGQDQFGFDENFQQFKNPAQNLWLDNSSLSDRDSLLSFDLQQRYPETHPFDAVRRVDSNTEEFTSLALFNLPDESSLNTNRLPDISKTFDNFAAFSPYSLLSQDHFEETSPHFQEFDHILD